MLSIFVKCICKVNNPMNGCGVSSQTGALRVDPALLHDGRHSLLIFTFVLLIELSRLTVGWAVWIGLV